jgi:adenylate cyclase
LQSNAYYGDVIYELNLVPDAFSKMEDLAHKAVALDPNLQIARYNLVVQHAFFGRAREAAEEARKVAAMNPNRARIIAGCGSELTTVGEYDLGKELIERAQRLNRHYPSWYHFVDYLIYFRHKRYAQAWPEALKIHAEGVLWHPLLRAAALGKLGRTEEARGYLYELLEMRPDFPARSREIIRLIFVLDEHIDMIWDGLRKAGMGAST